MRVPFRKLRGSSCREPTGECLGLSRRGDMCQSSVYPRSCCVWRTTVSASFFTLRDKSGPKCVETSPCREERTSAACFPDCCWAGICISSNRSAVLGTRFLFYLLVDGIDSLVGKIIVWLEGHSLGSECCCVRMKALLDVICFPSEKGSTA